MKDLVRIAVDRCAKRGCSFADVRGVERLGTSISRQDGRADRVSSGESYGLGVRVLCDGGWGFASMSAATRDRLDECIDGAVAMARASKGRGTELTELAAFRPIEDEVPARFVTDPRSVPVAHKMKVLAGLEQAAIGKHGGKLVNTVVSYSDSVETTHLCNALGTMITSTYVRTMIGTSMTAQDGDFRQRGHEHQGRLCGAELLEQVSAEDLTEKAAGRAVALLSARRAPAGKFPVIFHPSIAGLFVHEALGHNAEADLVLAGESILEGKLGQRIASEVVNVVDDGTVPESWGSYVYDSEGVPAQRREIIKDGVLMGYMQSLQTAARLGVPANGSARAEGHHHRPVVRMSNTFIVPGELTLEEMMADMQEGILLAGGHWGYVMCEKGQYTCHAGEGWMIRNGEKAEHIRDVSIASMTLDTLMNIEAVSRDFEMQMPGMCGKAGQGMPVNGGGPYVRVREVVVGGQE